MFKSKKRGLAAAFAAVGLIIIAVLAWMLPYWLAGSSMAENTQITLELQSDGSILAGWTPAENCDGYVVTVTSSGGDTLFEASTVQPQCSLPDLSGSGEAELSVSTWRSFSRFGSERVRIGGAVKLKTDLEPPRLDSLEMTPDPDSKTAAFSWSGAEGDTARLSLTNGGETRIIGDYSGGGCTLSFGEGAELNMPEYGESYVFEAAAVREGENFVFYGQSAPAVTLVRDDLLGLDLNMKCDDKGHNIYELSWDETKGEGYRIQLRDSGGEWQTIAELDKTAEHSYTTGRLTPFEDFEIRILAFGENMEETIAGPESTSIRTGASAVYASVWPIVDLEMYDSAARSTVLCTVPQASCCCVIAEEGDMFLVRYDSFIGYIDSSYCLINLPDYIGHLCAYDITNSYDSLYMVHEFEIPEVTGTVVAGYENVELKEGEYLAPLLYPVAQKLIPAAQSALADGYRIKIYDSFRPNMATRSIYDLTESIIQNPLPEAPYLEDVDIEELNLPEPFEGAEAVTYYQLVTNGVYDLANFLARSGSYHNLGIAMDMTLETADTGEELEMQTRMHDLSWYSATRENNQNAYLLASYMTAAGFGGLTSEWWHFQDVDTKNELNLTNYMWSGVTSAGWHHDGKGWLYCTADGTAYRNRTIQIGGADFTFDSSGYLIENK